MEVTYSLAGDNEVPLVRELFSEYGSSLGVDLSFQEFAEELEALPGKYAPPDGAVIIARREGSACGCVAMRRSTAFACEMKRLYVRPAARGLGIGAGLVQRILDVARSRGYLSMRLDTVPFMKSAIALYVSFGFREIPAYIFNPLPGALYMEKAL